MSDGQIVATIVVRFTLIMIWLVIAFLGLRSLYRSCVRKEVNQMKKDDQIFKTVEEYRNDLGVDR